MGGDAVHFGAPSTVAGVDPGNGATTAPTIDEASLPITIDDCSNGASTLTETQIALLEAGGVPTVHACSIPTTGRPSRGAFRHRS